MKLSDRKILFPKFHGFPDYQIFLREIFTREENLKDKVYKNRPHKIKELKMNVLSDIKNNTTLNDKRCSKLIKM